MQKRRQAKQTKSRRRRTEKRKERETRSGQAPGKVIKTSWVLGVALIVFCCPSLVLLLLFSLLLFFCACVLLSTQYFVPRPLLPLSSENNAKMDKEQGVFAFGSGPRHGCDSAVERASLGTRHGRQTETCQSIFRAHLYKSDTEYFLQVRDTPTQLATGHNPCRPAVAPQTSGSRRPCLEEFGTVSSKQDSKTTCAVRGTDCGRWCVSLYSLLPTRRRDCPQTSSRSAAAPLLQRPHASLKHGPQQHNNPAFLALVSFWLFLALLSLGQPQGGHAPFSLYDVAMPRRREPVAGSVDFRVWNELGVAWRGVAWPGLA